jgi:DNA (cytosine-5)-methyltransferase 1
MLNVLDLFSGIGGFSLGLERAGMRTVAFCEIDEFCRSVLGKHWPSVPIHNDAKWLRDVRADIVVGGPPCQRTSVAAAIHGHRTGETLWPVMFRIIGDSGCDRAIVEQPPGNATWETQVETDLEGAGFGLSRHVVAAGSLGARHRRRRVFYVADRDRARLSLTRRSLASALERLQGRGPAGDHWSADRARAVRVVDGVPGRLDRAARIHALGNAVVPQIPEIIGRAILEAEGLEPR